LPYRAIQYKVVEELNICTITHNLQRVGIQILKVILIDIYVASVGGINGGNITSYESVVMNYVIVGVDT